MTTNTNPPYRYCPSKESHTTHVYQVGTKDFRCPGCAAGSKRMSWGI